MGGESDDNRPLEGLTDAELSVDDAHVRAAWRSWLSALATDAEAALAAAFAYDALPAEGRDAWLDALTDDAPLLGVPAVALYAPLLAVEVDCSRRARIEHAITTAPRSVGRARSETSALRGVARDGVHACAIVLPLYLDFVEVLYCRYTPSGGFVAVRHDPMRHSGDVGAWHDVDGVAVEPTPLRIVVEELAHAVLADKREQRTTPRALASFAHLFAPDLADAEDAEPSRP